MPAAPTLVARQSKESLVPTRDYYGNLYYIDPNNPPVLGGDDDIWWGRNTLGGKYVGNGFTVGGIVGLVLLCLMVIFTICFIFVCFRRRGGRSRPSKRSFKPVPGNTAGTRDVGDLEDEDYMNLPGPSTREKGKKKTSGGLSFSGFSVPKFFKRGGDGKKGEGNGKFVGSESGAAKEHYRKLNLPDMVGSARHDEAMIGSSPPHTPSAAFGWNNSAGAVAAGREVGRGGDTSYLGSRGGPPSESGSEYGPPKYTPPATTASSTTSGENGGEARRGSSRISGNWDEMYQSKPSPNLFDDDDKELYSRRGY